MMALQFPHFTATEWKGGSGQWVRGPTGLEAALASQADYLYLDRILEIIHCSVEHFAYLVSSSHKLSCDTIDLKSIWEAGLTAIIMVA